MLTSISFESFEVAPLTLFDKDWCLITVNDHGRVNTMTASWGGLGTLWNQPIATIFVRPTRFTHELLKNEKSFTISFFEKKYKPALSYLGSVSGRETDKIKESGLTLVQDERRDTFEEAVMVIRCSVLYEDVIKPECFIVDGLEEKVYPKKDYHTMYIARIQEILVKEDSK